jgi:hypothetical protein
MLAVTLFKNFKVMTAIERTVYDFTLSGLTLFALNFHNHFIPSGLNTVDEQIRKLNGAKVVTNKLTRN